MESSLAEAQALLYAGLRLRIEGDLDGAETRVDPVFGLVVPLRVPGVDERLLDPRSTWRDPELYDRKARDLARMFADNFAARFPDADEAVRAAGPSV